jgi:hypothetical protein
MWVPGRVQGVGPDWPAGGAARSPNAPGSVCERRDERAHPIVRTSVENPHTCRDLLVAGHHAQAGKVRVDIQLYDVALAVGLLIRSGRVREFPLCDGWALRAKKTCLVYCSGQRVRFPTRFLCCSLGCWLEVRLSRCRHRCSIVAISALFSRCHDGDAIKITC